MKQFIIKKERVLDENTFYIRAFPAFVAANLSGELSALVMPLLTSAVPMLAGAEKENIMDMEAETVAPVLANGLSAINGDKVEALLKKLLVKHKNISVQLEGEREAQALTEDLVNELFCGEAQGLFILAWDVIQANFSGFFKKLGDQFGGLLNVLR